MQHRELLSSQHQSEGAFLFFSILSPSLKSKTKRKVSHFHRGFFFSVSVVELTHFLCDVLPLASCWFLNSVLKVVVKQQRSASSLELAALSSPNTQHVPRITALECFPTRLHRPSSSSRSTANKNIHKYTASVHV